MVSCLESKPTSSKESVLLNEFISLLVKLKSMLPKRKFPSLQEKFEIRDYLEEKVSKVKEVKLEPKVVKKIKGIKNK